MPLSRSARRIAGADVTVTRDGRSLIAGIVVCDRMSGEILERVSARREAVFPYVPGLLSFREAPAVLAAMRKLRTRPDVVLFDGQGLAHPRRLGLACHVGLFADLPSVGCAKSRLIGRHDEPGPRKGDWATLVDADEEIGRVVRTRDGVKPVYVSVGHLLRLEDAVWLVLACCTRYRLPEPTRLAHQYVTRMRKEVD